MEEMILVEVRKILKEEMKDALKLYNKIESLNTKGFFTINSSPYAHEVYKHLGFIDTDKEQSVNGLKFYPMNMKFKV